MRKPSDRVRRFRCCWIWGCTRRASLFRLESCTRPADRSHVHHSHACAHHPMPFLWASSAPRSEAAVPSTRATRGDPMSPLPGQGSLGRDRPFTSDFLPRSLCRFGQRVLDSDLGGNGCATHDGRGSPIAGGHSTAPSSTDRRHSKGISLFRPSSIGSLRRSRSRRGAGLPLGASEAPSLRESGH